MSAVYTPCNNNNKRRETKKVGWMFRDNRMICGNASIFSFLLGSCKKSMFACLSTVERCLLFICFVIYAKFEEKERDKKRVWYMIYVCMYVFCVKCRATL